MKDMEVFKDRIRLSERDIEEGNYSLEKKYYINSICLKGISIHFLDIDLFINGFLDFRDLPNLNYISEKVSIDDECYVQIYDCPKLKTIPKSFFYNKSLSSVKRNLYLPKEQYLITILSEEEFKSVNVSISFNGKLISYQEYSSLLENTLQKNNLIKVCTL